jgi:imidazole glycerol-phosphate synthase subunit HisF
MLLRRLIVCLDVKAGRVVKGTRFVALRDVGDPAALAAHYEREGADEICFLDISASAEERGTLLDVARQTAERLFIPLTIGGGVRSADDVGRVLRAGADKVSVNTAAVEQPEVLSEVAARFGAQCVVASIDAKKRAVGGVGGTPAAQWEVYVRGGRQPTGLDAVEWARECAQRGAGEILLTSIDRDGARVGYDLELTRAVAEAVDVPVIASGGAGVPAHVPEVLLGTNADAALVAGILHDGLTTVVEIKAAMRAKGIAARDGDG